MSDRSVNVPTHENAVRFYVDLFSFRKVDQMRALEQRLVSLWVKPHAGSEDRR